MSDDTPLVTAVLLNWNNYSDTKRCVESLSELDYDDLRILVVDNGSTDGSGERIESELPAADLVYTGENLGFSGGVNVGIERALDDGTEYVWIVNNDTLYPDHDVLETLVRTAERRQSVGLVTPLLRKYPNTNEIYFERGYVDDRSYNAGHYNGRYSVLDLRFHTNVTDVHGDHSVVQNDYVPLCSALVGREVIEDVGLLPADYFLYYEDADYCVRIAAAGYDLLTHLECEAYHRGEGSSDSYALPTYYCTRNRFLFARRHRSVDAGFLLMALWRMFATASYYLAHGNLDVVYAALLGTYHGWNGKTGRGPYP